MREMILGFLFLAIIKIIDNLLTTAKSITTYQNKKVISSILVAIGQVMFYVVIKQVITDATTTSIAIVAVSSGIGTYIAFLINDKFQKDIMYMNIITCSDIQWMIELNDYLVENSIKCVLSNSLTRGKEDTYTLTIFSNTKEQSKMMDRYLEASDKKYLRQIVK